MQLEGKTAFIAGAGRNNGRAIALTFAREGADLVLVARQRKEELEQVAQECEAMGVRTLQLLADLSQPEEVERAVASGLEHFGKIDTLVSVAGLRPHKNVWEISYEEWHQVMAVNLHATFYLAKAVVPHMMERRTGSLIALGGIASLTAQPQRAHVIASKTGLYGLIKALAYELGPYGIRANLLALSFIKNQRLNPEWQREGDGTERNSSDIEATPLRREGTPQEAANVALFLASDQSSYVTGDRIVCAGGRYI